MEDSYSRWPPTSHHGGSNSHGRPPPPGPPPPPPPSLRREPQPPQRWSSAEEPRPRDGNNHEETRWLRTSPPTRVLIFEHLPFSMSTAAHVARSILTIDRSMTRSLQRTILIGYPDEQDGRTGESSSSGPAQLAFALFKSIDASQYALDALRAQQLFQRKTSEAGGSAYSPQRELHVDFARFSSHFVRADDLTSPQDQEREGALLWKTAWIDDDESSTSWQYVDEGARCQEWKRGMPLPEDLGQEVAGQSGSATSSSSTSQQKQTNGAAVHKRPKDPASSSSSSSLAAQAHLVGGKKKAAHNIANWAKKQEELHGGATAPPQVAAEALTPQGKAVFPEKGPAMAAAAAPPGPASLTKTTPGPASAVAAVSDPSSFPSATAMTAMTAESFTDPRPTVLACYLCARRFKTAAILARHEAESELHRGNLADEGKKREARERRREAEMKERGEQEATTGVETGSRVGDSGNEVATGQDADIAAESAATAASSPPLPQSKYRDRALERRAAFGVDESALKEAKRAKRYHPYEQQARTFVPGPEAPPPSTETVPPAAAEPQPAGGRALDTSNVGHAMLLAMGWTAGSGLGEGERQGRVEPVEAALSHLGGEERAGIGASAAAGRERTTVAPGVVAWQTSMLEQAREARRRRYEASGGDEGEEKAEQGR